MRKKKLRLIGFNIHAPQEESAVISVTEPTILTSADTGKTYSLDGVTARVYFPLRASLTVGWTITVQCTVTMKAAFAIWESGQGICALGGEPYDGVSLDTADAVATITYDGTYFQAVAVAGTVTGYLD